MKSKPKQQHVLLKLILILTGLVVLLGAGGLGTIILAPGAAAQGADTLRAVIGDQAVAQMETVIYQAQDTYLRWKYSHSSQAQAQAPWQSMATPGSQIPAAENTVVSAAHSSAPAAITTPTQGSPSNQAGTLDPVQPAAVQKLSTAAPPAEWTLASLAPLGKAAGEGLWTPYLSSPSGKTSALRTFLQPDPTRPYALVAVVAFDLKTTHLHFVIGRDEPYSTVAIKRDGLIPTADRVPGVLIATFNGGFKGRHGHFGVIVNGVEVIPPTPDLGTLAFYKDGSLRMGAWGSEILPSADLLTLRQNGPLVVHAGQINPHVADDNPQVWGYTVKETAPIWRSAIGLSADGQVLYYFAGPSLTLPSLAQAIQAAGAANAIQLDINNFWVHFDAILNNDGKLEPQTLFPEWQNEFSDRYLQPYTRDYFYVTTSP